MWIVELRGKSTTSIPYGQKLKLMLRAFCVPHLELPNQKYRR